MQQTAGLLSAGALKIWDEFSSNTVAAQAATRKNSRPFIASIGPYARAQFAACDSLAFVISYRSPVTPLGAFRSQFPLLFSLRPCTPFACLSLPGGYDQALNRAELTFSFTDHEQ